MLFEKRPVAETKNTILAHSLKLAETTFKKGHIISQDDIDLFSEDGIESITVAILQEGDIGENEAAALLAKELEVAGIELDGAFTGRCNLYSQNQAIFVVNEEAIGQINQVHESITLASLPNYSLVGKRQMLATIKIIPYSVSKLKLVECLQVIKQHIPVIQVHQCEAKSVGLIQTRLPRQRKTILDKTTNVLGKRLQALGSKLTINDVCEHDESAIVDLIHKQLETAPDILIISSASAISDRRDVVPAAISAAGGHIHHFGMPVDPGNLLLMAEINNTPVIGMPGCARSPKLNGFDFIIQRMVANIPITNKDIMSMGVGGLLKEIESRPQKREK
jgi:molybdenum cofactor cytidylyltransferase